MRKKLSICLMLCLIFLGLPATAVAQQSETQVTGMVTDQQKEPLPGVTVTVVGTQTRAITDMDGLFKIQVPNKNSSELEFSYMGFKKKTVKVNGSKLLSVALD